MIYDHLVYYAEERPASCQLTRNRTALATREGGPDEKTEIKQC